MQIKGLSPAETTKSPCIEIGNIKTAIGYPFGTGAQNKNVIPSKIIGHILGTYLVDR